MRKTNQKKKDGKARNLCKYSEPKVASQCNQGPFALRSQVQILLCPLLSFPSCLSLLNLSASLSLSLSLLNLPRSICQVPESTRVVPAPTPRIRGEVSVANSEPDTRWAFSFSKQLRLPSVLHGYVSAHRIIASRPRRTAAGLQSEAPRRACARNPPIPGYRLVPKSTSIFALGPMQKCLKFICQLDTNVHAKGNYPHQDLTVVVKC